MLQQPNCTKVLVLVAEQAYDERVRFDQAIALLQSAAKETKSAKGLEASLAGYKPEVQEMPTTSAVLATIPASDTHPGALYRLAGDRSALCTSDSVQSSMLFHPAHFDTYSCIALVERSCLQRFVHECK